MATKPVQPDWADRYGNQLSVILFNSTPPQRPVAVTLAPERIVDRSIARLHRAGKCCVCLALGVTLGAAAFISAVALNPDFARNAFNPYIDQ